MFPSYCGNRPSLPPTATPANLPLVRTQDEIILLLGREVNRLSDFEIESKYKDTVIMNLRSELADLSQRLSETAAARQSDRGTLKFQGLNEGDDPRQKEIENMKSQVGPGDKSSRAQSPHPQSRAGVQVGGAGRGASRTSWRQGAEGHQGPASQDSRQHVLGPGEHSLALPRSSDASHRDARSCQSLRSSLEVAEHHRLSSALPS